MSTVNTGASQVITASTGTGLVLVAALPAATYLARDVRSHTVLGQRVQGQRVHSTAQRVLWFQKACG
jgi:hypothetical protein